MITINKNENWNRRRREVESHLGVRRIEICQRHKLNDTNITNIQIINIDKWKSDYTGTLNEHRTEY